jgi:DNA-binding NarL/FixJ family response regulator
MKSVAVVEDDQGLRSQIVKLIEMTSDMECVGAFASAEEALYQMGKRSPDVILMDIKLPGMSGIELLTMIKKFEPATQIIMVTIYEDSELIFEALKAGADGYLIKSSPPGEMLNAIRDACNGSAPLSGSIALRVMEHFRNIGPSSHETENLSARELQVLDLLAMGLIYKEIGLKLDITAETVRSHVKRICQKLHVGSRIEAVSKHRARDC